MSSKVSDTRGNRVAIGLVPAFYDRVDCDRSVPNTEIYSFYNETTKIAEVTVVNDVAGNFLSAERTQ